MAGATSRSEAQQPVSARAAAPRPSAWAVAPARADDWQARNTGGRRQTVLRESQYQQQDQRRETLESQLAARRLNKAGQVEVSAQNP